MRRLLICFLLSFVTLSSFIGCTLPKPDPDMFITLHLPSGVSVPEDTPVVLFMSDDETWIGNWSTFPKHWGTEATFTYSTNTKKSNLNGTYYLYALVNTTGDIPEGGINSLGNWLTFGDYLGFYGGSGTNPPGAPNVTLPHKENKTYHIHLSKHLGF